MFGAGEFLVDSIRACFLAAQARMRFLTQRYPGLMGFCLVFTVLLLGSNHIFGLQDEGYLWYGAQRVLAGEIPLRDFQSYDPGRYYWSAAVMALLGSHGLVALHVAAALFAALGAWIACQLLFRRQPRPEPWLFLMVVFIFIVWMNKWFKLFDVTASVMLVAFLTSAPPNNRHAIAASCPALGVRDDCDLGSAISRIYGPLADVGGARLSSPWSRDA